MESDLTASPRTDSDHAIALAIASNKAEVTDGMDSDDATARPSAREEVERSWAMGRPRPRVHQKAERTQGRTFLRRVQWRWRRRRSRRLDPPPAVVGVVPLFVFCVFLVSASWRRGGARGRGQ